MTTDFILYVNQETGRKITAPADPPELRPVFSAAWLGLPEDIRGRIAERLPWGGLAIRFSDLSHLKAAGACGSDSIRISRDYLDRDPAGCREDLINTIQHELIHFFLGHPLNQEPAVKNELEARELLINSGLETAGDYVYLEKIDRLAAIAKKVNTVPAAAWYEAAAILREELSDQFLDRGESVDYLIELTRDGKK